jgi:hypothetical protein
VAATGPTSLGAIMIHKVPPTPLRQSVILCSPLQSTPSHCTVPGTASLYRRYLYDHIEELGALGDASIDAIGFVKGAVISVRRHCLSPPRPRCCCVVPVTGGRL